MSTLKCRWNLIKISSLQTKHFSFEFIFASELNVQVTSKSLEIILKTTNCCYNWVESQKLRNLELDQGRKIWRVQTRLEPGPGNFENLGSRMGISEFFWQPEKIVVSGPRKSGRFWKWRVPDARAWTNVSYWVLHKTISMLYFMHWIIEKGWNQLLSYSLFKSYPAHANKSQYFVTASCSGYAT